MINRVLVTLFKTVAFVVIGLSLVSLFATTFLFFTAYSKIDSVCTLMQGELSRNNCLLDVSMTSENGFIPQLLDICDQTANIGVVNDPNAQNGVLPLFELESIKVYEVADGGVEQCVATYYENDIPNSNVDETAGEYGTMKRIDVTFQTNFVGRLVGSVNNRMGLAEAISTQTQTYSYYAPCLRYIK